MKRLQFVKALCDAALLPGPDREALSKVVAALKKGQAPEQIGAQFFPAMFRKLDMAPPLRVELALTREQEHQLWAHVGRVWSNLGSSQPYWSVVSDPRWTLERMTQAEVVDAFYDSGRWDLTRLDSWLERSHLSLAETGTCAEYGCGVGRCTVWLAKRFARVVAFDISEPHLRLARARAEQEGLKNIEFVHVRSEDDLQRLKEIDFFYSIIVLQHSPPPVIVSILRHAFEGLRQGGSAFFQVPTYAIGYSFNLQEYLGSRVDHGGEIEMHLVPQPALFDLASAHGMQPLEVAPDDRIGNYERWISTSFLMTKRGDSRDPH